MFHCDALCEDSNNKFYNINAVTDLLAVAGSILVGGQNKQVVKIMTYKRQWIINNWKNPISNLAGMCEA